MRGQGKSYRSKTVVLKIIIKFGSPPNFAKFDEDFLYDGSDPQL